MRGFEPSPGAFGFHSTFSGIPVVIVCEVNGSEGRSGRDVSIVPMLCIMAPAQVDLCEDAGLLHAEELKRRPAQAQSHFPSLGVDEPELGDAREPGSSAAVVAKERWIAQRDHVCCSLVRR